MYRAFLLALLMPLAALAQPQPPRADFPWWETPLVRDLNLTEQQQRQIQDILRDSRQPLSDLRDELERVEAELSAQFNQDPIDESKASRAIDNAVKARSDLTRAYSQMSLRLREVLTPEQWQELQRRQNSMRDRGRSGGRRGGRGGDDRRKIEEHGPKSNPPI